MSSHFKWYPASEEVVVPWNARYSFPSQANKCVKITPRIPPKNGAVFLPGNIIRIEFPAQGYVNPQNTTFEFDVSIISYGVSGTSCTRIQNNVQSLFNRVRLLYGATPLEDMINYNQVVRSLTEWTSTNQTNSMDQVGISEGIGGFVIGQDAEGGNFGLMNTREAYIHGFNGAINTDNEGQGLIFLGGTGYTAVPNSTGQNGAPDTVFPGSANGPYTMTKRYQVNLALGLLTQDKLLPVKFMASQLAIEITLEQPDACLFAQPGFPNQAGTPKPTYVVGNVNMIPEILEFDASYDAMFLKGLQDGGVPIKFSSWHTFIFSTGSSSAVNLLIQERSRSVKALFAMQRRSPYTLDTDSGATFSDSCNNTTTINNRGSTMQSYQFRIGGRYFPAQPVQLSSQLGTSICNGGAEAFVELQKALNVVGDYRLSTSVNPLRWSLPAASNAPASAVNGYGPDAVLSNLNELDYTCSLASYGFFGNPAYVSVSNYTGGQTGNCFASNMGSACYASSIDLETSNGVEISGLNAEEQSDIAFIANWSSTQQNYNIEVYSYYDAMLILRENNVLELVQ